MGQSKIMKFIFLIFSILNLNSVELKKGIQTICVPDMQTLPCKKNQVPVDIFIPQKKSIGTILVLNGWNFPRDDWQKKTSILKEGEENSYNLIFPEMGRTIYESDYFPETKKKYFVEPGGKWVKEKLIPSLNQIGFLLEKENNFVMGLSTGGRGAVLVAMNSPKIFKKVASISGDFNQSLMPRDKLMINIYGPYEEFSDRWNKIDNPYTNAKFWDIPIYLGHGKKDKVVPFNQTEIYFQELKKLHPNLKIVFNASETEGHDYRYWESEVRPIFQFFKN
jgi:putative tributyrin esterase